MSIDTRSQSDLLDAMVVCTGTSVRHVKSIAENLVQQAKQAGISYVRAEGLEEGEWVLVDIGDVVVHVMQAEARDYYQIERLWQPFAEKGFSPAASHS